MPGPPSDRQRAASTRRAGRVGGALQRASATPGSTTASAERPARPSRRSGCAGPAMTSTRRTHQRISPSRMNDRARAWAPSRRVLARDRPPRGFGRPGLATHIDPQPGRVRHRHTVRRHPRRHNPSRSQHRVSTTSDGKTGLVAGLSTRSIAGSALTVTAGSPKPTPAASSRVISPSSPPQPHPRAQRRPTAEPPRPRRPPPNRRAEPIRRRSTTPALFPPTSPLCGVTSPAIRPTPPSWGHVLWGCYSTGR